MRAFHIFAICWHGLVALPFFAFMYAATGDWFSALMCGWSVFFGAYSTRALRRGA